MQKNKDFKKVLYYPNQNLSNKMKQALDLYRENIEFIEKSFKYNINNGVIKRINNLIKHKKIAFDTKNIIILYLQYS